MMAPIGPAGRAAGVLALQFPIAKINRGMTFDKHWESRHGPHRGDFPWSDPTT